MNDSIHQALRLKAAETRQSMSDLVNEALSILLSEDREDIADWKNRKNEKAIGDGEFLQQLKEDGTI